MGIIIEDHCDSVFEYSTSLSLTVGHPNFMTCFQYSILQWLPFSCILFFASLESIRYARNLESSKPSLPWNGYNIAKVAMTIMLVLIHLTQIIVGCLVDVEDDEELLIVFGVNFLSSLLFFTSHIISLGLLWLSIKFGFKSSPAIFMFLLISVLCGAAHYPSIAQTSNPCIAIFTIHFILSVVLFWQNCYADTVEISTSSSDATKDCPKQDSSFLSHLLFAWISPLMWKGFKADLQLSDLWRLEPSLTSKEVIPKFEKQFGATTENWIEESREGSSVTFEGLEKSRYKDMGSAVHSNMRNAKSISLFPPLVKTFGIQFLVGSVMEAVNVALSMVAPQILKTMISHIQERTANTEDENDQWKGYFLGGLLLITTIFQSILRGQYLEKMFCLAMNVRTSVISTIYKKSLIISSSARKESTTGEIVNLMAIDAQRFMEIVPHLNVAWSAPLQIFLCCYFMYTELGYAIFAGIGVLIAAFPINGVIAMAARKLQLHQMEHKDKRIKTLGELLNGIKVIKLYAWEKSFLQEILNIRNIELKTMAKMAGLNAIVSFVWTAIPFLVALASFAAFVFSEGGQILDPKKAFVVLSYLNILRWPMTFFPILGSLFVQATASMKRINKFLNSDNLDPRAVQHNLASQYAIQIKNGNFKWDTEDTPTLKDINISVKKGSLTAIIGKVGSGKSSLMSAFLGEMIKISGKVNIMDNVAYVPQQAWMQNATVKDNILFGKELNQTYYEQILDVCALRTDCKMLAGGDHTEIGEKGINLSGGQKQRISLARAVYSQADMFVFDDPLSAVDAHVGQHIFDKVIGKEGILQDKTRLLVTNNVTFLRMVDHIILMKEGEVCEEGTFEELIDSGGHLTDFLVEKFNQNMDEENLDGLQVLMQQNEDKLKMEAMNLVKDSNALDDRKTSKQMSLKDKLSKQRQKSVAKLIKSLSVEPERKEPKANLIEVEAIETGHVKWDVYKYYLTQLGWFGVILFTINLLYKGSAVATDYWLNIWTNNTLGDSAIPQKRDLYLGVYGGFGIAQALLGVAMNLTLAISTLRASKIMHRNMLNQIIKSPMSFFDTTPLGRIINRFAKDIDVCDSTLPTNIRVWLSTIVTFVSTIILIASVIPLFIAIIIPIIAIFFVIQKIYVRSSRQLKRLQSVSQTPIYSHFSETLNGSSTIRAFKKEKDFIKLSEEKVDKNQTCYYYTYMATRWSQILLENMGNILTFSAAMLAMAIRDSIDPSEVGLIILYALNVTLILNWLVLQTSEIETNIVAVERIKEYTGVTQEASWDTKSNENEENQEWPPKDGQIQFQNFSMRYRDGLDLVLNSISFEVKGGERVGIVGRTGAGKSSLTMALFRLIEPSSGKILIDGVDISTLGLHDLRSQITIIPQDPVLFSGTLRMNLDPFHESTDDQIWSALKLSHLYDFIVGLKDGISFVISEGGENLSVGQRQLVCLARALLKKSKILVLDEATAAVDPETDELIQNTIRSEFIDCTILTIAHRINTIIDYDRIIVLDKGRLAEFDTIPNLLQDQQGIFYSLVQEAGLIPP